MTVAAIEDWIPGALRDLRLLPEADRPFVVLRAKGLSQAEIARELGYASQANVSIRLRLIRRRLDVLRNIMVPTPEEIVERYGAVLTPRQIETLTTFFECGSQSETGRRLGVSQTSARHFLMQARARIAQVKGSRRDVDALDAIRADPSLLHCQRQPKGPRDWMRKTKSKRHSSLTQ